MWILMLEALGALSILVFIVWWTMFCGQKPVPRSEQKTALPKGELSGDEPKNLPQKDQ